MVKSMILKLLKPLQHHSKKIKNHFLEFSETPQALRKVYLTSFLRLVVSEFAGAILCSL